MVTQIILKLAVSYGDVGIGLVGQCWMLNSGEVGCITEVLRDYLKKTKQKEEIKRLKMSRLP